MCNNALVKPMHERGILPLIPPFLPKLMATKVALRLRGNIIKEE